MDAWCLKKRPAAPIETFARFQAGFLSSEDFHCFPSIFMVFHRFRWIAGLARLARLARFAGFAGFAGFARLAGRFGFLVLLEGGLVNVLRHARRSGEVGGFRNS